MSLEETTEKATKENCPVCGHKGVHITYEIGGNTGMQHTYGCNDCGIFLSTLEEWRKLADLADEVRGKEWMPVKDAPICVAGKINSVLVTRIPYTGKPIVMIAHLTTDGWKVKTYLKYSKRYGTKLHFEPTHFQPISLPQPPQEEK